MSINLGLCRLGVMRQYDQNGNVTASALAKKPSFGKVGDQDGGLSGFRALFVGGGHSIAYLLKRTVQKVQIYTSFKALTQIRNKHDKASQAEIARLDKKIRKNPTAEEFQARKSEVVTTRINAAKNAVDQALVKQDVANKNKASLENKAATLKAEIIERLNTTTKVASATGENEPASAAGGAEENTGTNETQEQPKTLHMLVKELHEVDRELRLANHLAQAAAKRVEIETDAYNRWENYSSSGGVVKELVEKMGSNDAISAEANILPTSAGVVS